MAGGRVTAVEVARRAGVSTATVSLVLNGKDEGRIVSEKRDRVLAAINELGYRVDRRGRSLATGRTGVIAFIAPDVANPFFGMVQMGILDELESNFQLVTVATRTGGAVAATNVQQALDLGVDGIILATQDTTISQQLPGRLPPVVVLDRPGKSDSTPHVNVDVEASARSLAKHLISLGHRRVVYLEATTNSPTLRSRRKALVSTFSRSRADTQTMTVRSPIHINNTREVVLRHWSEWARQRVTAVVCATDFQAYGVILAVEELGLAVPRDISVTGGEDLPSSLLVRPALTTVHIPAYDLGRAGAERLRRLMLGEPIEPRALVLPTSLRVRESTGPAPAG